MVTIRKSTEHDLKAIFELIVDFAHFIKTPEKVTITLDQMMADKELFKCLVAEDDKKIVGFASYYFTYFSWTGKASYLDDLYVIPAYRNQKIGTKLMDYFIEISKLENCKQARWQVSNWNKEAIAFYKKRGCKINEVDVNCDLKL